MPIRVQCKCGQTLNVPDQYAGKSGKCPKCGEAVKIPLASAATPNGSPAKEGKEGTATPKPSPKTAAASGSTAKSPTPKPKVATATQAKGPTAKAGMDDLFDQVGLVKKSGHFCPNCDTRIAQGTALCVKCGFNLETGQKVQEFATESSRQEFENKHLNEAARMMRREDALEERTRNLGMPWWAMLCMILFGALVVICGVMLVDAHQTGLKPANTISGKVARLPFLVLMATLMAINSILTGMFAHFAIVAHGFKDKAKHGWGSLLLPLYAMIYGLKQIKKIRGTVLAYWMAILLGIPSIIYAAMKLPSDFLQF